MAGRALIGVCFLFCNGLEDFNFFLKSHHISIPWVGRKMKKKKSNTLSKYIKTDI